MIFSNGAESEGFRDPGIVYLYLLSLIFQEPITMILLCTYTEYSDNFLVPI